MNRSNIKMTLKGRTRQLCREPFLNSMVSLGTLPQTITKTQVVPLFTNKVIPEESLAENSAYICVVSPQKMQQIRNDR